MSVKKLFEQFLSVFGVFSIYFSYTFYNIFSLPQNVFLFSYLITALFYYFLISGNIERVRIYIVAFFVTLSTFISTSLGDTFFSRDLQSVFFYLPILTGYLFYRDFNTCFKIIKVILLFNFLLILYEYISISYIFPPTVDLPEFYGRAKGVFSYSKEMASVLIIISSLYLPKLKGYWFWVLFISSLLSGSRLAVLVVSSCILIEVIYRNRIYFRRNFERFIVYSPLVLILLVIVIIAFFQTKYAHVTYIRMLGAFDVTHSSNVERISFWTQYISIFSSYDLVHLLFGYPNKASLLVGNGAESSYLNLLVDGGFFALFLYLLCFFIIFLNVNGLNVFICVLLLVCSMQITRVGIGFVDGSLLWMYFWNVVLRNLGVNSNEQQ